MILHAKFPTYLYKFMKYEHIAIFNIHPLTHGVHNIVPTFIRWSEYER